MSGFESAREAIEEKFGGESASPDANQEVKSSDQAPQVGEQAPVAQAIAELDKMDKFKLDGQEWTLKDLKAAIMRQKDYTQKTQSLAETRKTFDDSKKYYENLAWDLRSLEKNPALIHEFIKVYPADFHKYAEEVLKLGNSSQVSTQGQAQQQVQQSQPQVDVQLLSRVNNLEKFYHEQEVSKNEKAIEHTLEKFSKQYPDAANFREVVLGRAYEAHMQGVTLNESTWEDIFKQVDQEMSGLLKEKYGNMVQKQKEANAKARDVGAGGGTVTASPKKFKNLGEVTKFAIDELTGRDR